MGDSGEGERSTSTTRSFGMLIGAMLTVRRTVGERGGEEDVVELASRVGDGARRYAGGKKAGMGGISGEATGALTLRVAHSASAARRLLMRTLMSSDPTAIGLPLSETLPSLESEVSETTSVPTKVAASKLGTGSMKASYSAFWKKSSESGSKWFHALHRSQMSTWGSGSVLTTGTAAYV